MPSVDFQSSFKTTKCSQSENSTKVVTEISEAYTRYNEDTEKEDVAVEKTNKKMQKEIVPTFPEPKKKPIISLSGSDIIADEFSDESDADTPYRYTFKKAVRRVSATMATMKKNKVKGQQKKSENESQQSIPNKKKKVRFVVTEKPPKKVKNDGVDFDKKIVSLVTSVDDINGDTTGTGEYYNSCIPVVIL